MIPLSDHNPTSRKALLCPLLIAANVVIFFFIQPSFSGDPEEQLRFNLCRASIPYEVMQQKRIADSSADEFEYAGAEAFVGEIDPEATSEQLDQALVDEAQEACPRKSIWLSILSSLFFHGGLLHLAGNMLFLWVFGNNIEDRLGIARFAIFYLGAGIAATYAQSVASADSAIPLIGASGAIAGVLGAYLVLYPRARVKTLIIFFLITIVELPAVVVLGVWFALQLFQGIGPGVSAGDNVAYLAHIGGFVAGMLLLLLFRPRKAVRARWE